MERETPRELDLMRLIAAFLRNTAPLLAQSAYDINKIRCR
jgi:hypothetical protein